MSLNVNAPETTCLFDFLLSLSLACPILTQRLQDYCIHTIRLGWISVLLAHCGGGDERRRKSRAELESVFRGSASIGLTYLSRGGHPSYWQGFSIMSNDTKSKRNSKMSTNSQGVDLSDLLNFSLPPRQVRPVQQNVPRRSKKPTTTQAVWNKERK